MTVPWEDWKTEEMIRKRRKKMYKSDLEATQLWAEVGLGNQKYRSQVADWSFRAFK